MPLDEALATFLDDFATAATFDGAASINGIFDRAYAEPMGLAGRSPVFRCLEADAPDPVGKTLIIGSTGYTIRGAEPDGLGFTVLQLEE